MGDTERASKFLKRQEAADFLNLQISTLEAWATRGGGPRFCKFGRAVRYCLSDLEKYVEKSKRRRRSEPL